MSARGERGLDGRIAAGVFVGLAALYWLLRCPSYGPGDSAQHALSALTLGVSRPPGYPLYVFLAHAFAALAPGGGAAAVGGFSGVCEGGAVALLFWCLRRQGCSRAGAAGAAALAAFAPLLWYYAEVPEVRALNQLLALASLALGLRYAERPSRGAAAAFGLAAGLGLSHHPTFAFVIPSLLLASRPARAPGRGEVSAACAAAVFGCALPYAALWLRLRVSAPVYNAGAVQSAADALALFLRRDTGGLAHVVYGGGRTAPAATLALQLRWLARSLWRDATLAGLGLAALGVWALRESPRRAASWLLWLALPAGAYIGLSSGQLWAAQPDYLRGVVERFFLLPELGLFALAGWGLDYLGRRSRPSLAWALALAPALRLAAPVDLRAHSLSRDYAVAVAGQLRDGDVLVAASDDAVSGLLFERLVEGRARGAALLQPALLAYAPYVERLGRENPALNFPSRRGRLSRSLADWVAVNPGRAFYAEAVAGDSLAAEFPRQRADGLLLKLTPPFDPLDDRARRFENSPLAALSRRDVYDFTQETYLLDAAASLRWAYGVEAGRPFRAPR